MPEDKKTGKFLPRLLNRWLPPVIWVYFTFLFGWLVGYLILGNRFGPLAAVTQLAVFFFIPLPGAVLAALWLRNNGVWVGIVAAMIVFLFLWGGLFLPNSVTIAGDWETLRVMSYNTLGSQLDPAPVLALLRQEDVDVILFQELNPIVAEALAEDLGDVYPYQVMDARIGVEGSGAISKFPLVDSGEGLPLLWVGTPQVLILSWEGQEIVLVNFPDDFSRRCDFQQAVAVARADKRVVVRQPDGRKNFIAEGLRSVAIFSFLAKKWNTEFPNDFAVWRIFANGPVRLVANEVMTIR